MSEMVERAARALMDADEERKYRISHQDAVKFVRAIMIAMREPTDEMLDAGEVGSPAAAGYGDTGNVWIAMIDAGLSSAPPVEAKSEDV